MLVVSSHARAVEIHYYIPAALVAGAAYRTCCARVLSRKVHDPIRVGAYT